MCVAYGGIVRAGGECVSGRMKLDTVHIGLVAVEDLHVLACANVPYESNMIGCLIYC